MNIQPSTDNHLDMTPTQIPIPTPNMYVITVIRTRNTRILNKINADFQLAEWGKKFGDSDGYRGNWDSREDGQKNEEHERKAHSKESASSSHEHRHSKEDQKHQSKEEEEIHEAHKVDGLFIRIERWAFLSSYKICKSYHNC